MSNPAVLEICAGAGGQAIGLEAAGFGHVGAIEIDRDACLTLTRNRPGWRVIEEDVAGISGSEFGGIELLAGGVPCPPFSIAGKQLGDIDERDLFPQMVRLANEIRPRAVMIENVRGFATSRFDGYRAKLIAEFGSLGYECTWTVLNASDFGVPQLRPRFLLVAMGESDFHYFDWPKRSVTAPTVGEAVGDLMSGGGWPGATRWTNTASSVAPTIVGGSKKHGGPDLGPTRARAQWRQLGVDGLGIADHPPDESFPVDGLPRLTNRMVARIQGFPDEWAIHGGKTAAYRQIANAFPPAVAEAVGRAILDAFARLPAPRQRQLALANSSALTVG